MINPEIIYTSKSAINQHRTIRSELIISASAVKLLFFWVFVLTSFNSAIASHPDHKKVTVSGRIKTSDGVPVEFVNVALKGTNYGDLTDYAGNFQIFAPPGNYIFVARSMQHLNFEKAIVVTTAEINILEDIILTENVKQLEEVVVTGQFAPQSFNNSVYRVRAINRELIVQTGATEVKDLLVNQLGIRFRNDLVTGEADIQLLGMSGQNVKILLDGIPVIDRGSNRQSLSQIDLNTIERVEIVEGPMSVQYGTDALAGVINLISRKRSNGGNWPAFTLRLVEGSVGNEYSLEDGKGSRNLHGGLVYKHNSGLFAEANGTINNFGGWQGSFTGRAKEWRPRHQLMGQFGAGYRGDDSELWYRLNILDETIFGPGDPNIITNVATDRDFLTMRMSHQMHGRWRINPNFSLSVMGSFQDLERQTQTTTYNTLTGDRRLTLGQGDQDVSIFRNLFGRVTATNRLADNLMLQSGIEYRYDKGSGDRIQGTPSITDYAVFVSAEWEPLRLLKIRPGVRFISNSVYDAPPAIPSVNTKLSIGRNVDLRAGYAMGFRSPTLRELYFWFFNANHAIRGNQDLRAEHSDSFTGSVTFRPVQNELMHVNIVLSGFYNLFDDLIAIAQDVNNPGEHTFVNIDSHKTTGGTLEATLSMTNLTLNTGLSQVGRYNRYSENMVNSVFDWSPEFNAGIQYNIEKIRTNINVMYKYTGKRPFHEIASINGENIIRQAYVDDFHHADITVTNTINRNINIQLGLRNIFNVTTIRNTSMAGGGHNTSGPMPMGYGRSWFAGLHLNF